MAAPKRKTKRRWKHRPERDLLGFKVLRAIRGLTNAEVAHKAAKAGYAISSQTVRNMRMALKDGGTRFPQAYSMQAMLSSVGKGFRIADISETTRPAARQRASGAPARTRTNDSGMPVTLN